MPKLLSPEEFVLLKQCDAETELEENEVVGSLITRGLIRKSDVGDKLSDWQKYRICDNPVFPYITLEITEKCNFNCLHCFAAADNNALNAEMSYENILLILDQAVECGIQAVKITGGEPMLHPDFVRIMDAIYARGMWVFQINTNGYFLRQKIIDHLKQYPVWPLIKISYDGIGCHDTMRGVKGIEQHTLDAIKRSVDSGFRTMVTITVNRKNIDVVTPTLEMLEKLGVNSVWIVRTIEAPRWEGNADDETLNWTEYYSESLKIIEQYVKTEHDMELFFWSFVELNAKEKKYSFHHVKSNPEKFKPGIPLCRGCYGDVAVSASGTLYPCLQMSGYFKAHGMVMENALEKPLAELLKDSEYVKIARMRVDEKTECKDCKFFRTCAGGACMCTAYLTDGNFAGKNEPACIFFNDEWNMKLNQVLKGWKYSD